MTGLEALVAKLQSDSVKGEIWVDGGFLSKKLNPKDVDILVCSSALIYDSNPSIKQVLDWIEDEDLKPVYWCHSFKQLDYPHEHPMHVISQRTSDAWRRWYGHDRQGNPRGIAAVMI